MFSGHFLHLQNLNLHGHLNIILTHFVLFVHEFGLLDSKEYTALDDLIEFLDVFKKSSPRIGKEKSDAVSSPLKPNQKEPSDIFNANGVNNRGLS